MQTPPLPLENPDSASQTKPQRTQPKVDSPNRWLQVGLAALLVVFAVATRPQLQMGSPWWNFSPMVAVAIFAGVFFRRGWAFAVPLCAMLASDVIIEGAYRMGMTETWGFHWGMLYVYPTYVLLVAMGMLLRKPYAQLGKRGWPGLLGFWTLGVAGGAVGSVVFFLVTNFGSWVEYSTLYGTYAQTLAGLRDCYLAGLVFYRQSSTLVGDLAYTGALFGAYLVGERLLAGMLDQRELAAERVKK